MVVAAEQVVTMVVVVVVLVTPNVGVVPGVDVAVGASNVQPRARVHVAGHAENEAGVVVSTDVGVERSVEQGIDVVGGGVWLDSE